MSVLDSFPYWMGSPTSELSDLDATWSPSSNSNFSDQENSLNNQFIQDCQNGNVSMSSNCSTSSLGSFTIGRSDSSNTTGHERKRQKGAKRVHQRQAANQRERKRMKTINDAFEGLRMRIPMACSDRKLSKVDTLRMAIGYIQQLSELVNSCNTQNGGFAGKGNSENTKVIIKYHNTAGYQEYNEDMYGMQCPPLYGHSLSWENQNASKVGTDNKMTAKLWVPGPPTADDLTHLNALS